MTIFLNFRNSKKFGIYIKILKDMNNSEKNFHQSKSQKRSKPKLELIYIIKIYACQMFCIMHSHLPMSGTIGCIVLTEISFIGNAIPKSIIVMQNKHISDFIFVIDFSLGFVHFYNWKFLRDEVFAIPL